MSEHNFKRFNFLTIVPTMPLMFPEWSLCLHDFGNFREHFWKHMEHGTAYLNLPGVGILIPKIGISGSGLKKMESGRDGMGFSIPIFFGTGRDGVFRSRFFRDGTGLKKN